MSKWATKKTATKYLICKNVAFYSDQDEAFFFEWIEKIDCITSIAAAKNELYLDMVDRDLTTQEINMLIGFFARYKIKMKQLASFKTKANQAAFVPWEKEIFGKKIMHQNYADEGD